jgi:hypothetical protein
MRAHLDQAERIAVDRLMRIVARTADMRRRLERAVEIVAPGMIGAADGAADAAGLLSRGSCRGGGRCSGKTRKRPSRPRMMTSGWPRKVTGLASPFSGTSLAKPMAAQLSKNSFPLSRSRTTRDRDSAGSTGHWQSPPVAERAPDPHSPNAGPWSASTRRCGTCRNGNSGRPKRFCPCGFEKSRMSNRDIEHACRARLTSKPVCHTPLYHTRP